MEQIKRNELPEACFSTLASTGELVILKWGEQGYYPSDWETGERAKNQEIADFQNHRSSINPAQVRAMETGSVFGFHAPGANPQVYYDAGKLIDTIHADGIIKDPVISLFTPTEGSLYKYEIAGKEAYYLDLSAVPEPIMSRWSHTILLPDLIRGKPLVPVSAKWTGENRCTLTLESGCCAHDQEINADYQIIAKVGVGPVEYALAELPSAKYTSYATWERTSKNDRDGEPNYYWGHYHDNRQKAIEDFCTRASEKYEMLTEQHRPSIRAQLAAARPAHGEKAPAKANDKER